MARAPEPLICPWLGGDVRVRHDDSRLTPYGPRATVIRAAMSLASTPAGLQRVLEATVGDMYRIRVSPGDPPAIALRLRG